MVCDEDRAAAVARAVPPSSGDVGTVSPKMLGLFGLKRVAELAKQERLGTAGSKWHAVRGAKLDGHVAPLVVVGIAAIGAGSARPIAGADQHGSRRRDQARRS